MSAEGEGRDRSRMRAVERRERRLSSEGSEGCGARRMEAREREREGRKEDRDMELVRDERGSETGHSCFVGPVRSPPRRWREKKVAGDGTGYIREGGEKRG